MTLQDQTTLEQLRHLTVQVYRQLHLDARRLETATVDQWLASQSMPPADLERVINHIHLYDFFPDIEDDAELHALATQIAGAWQTALAKLDPRYRVVQYEGYGPEVTFFLDRESAA